MKEEALKLAQRVQIDLEQIVREEYEILILNELANSSFGKYLIFKGGTALRLAYKSPRFSEDLDFSLSKAISFSDFQHTLQALVKKFPNLKIKNLREKYFTIFALISIKEEFLPQSFSIKVEISRRPVKWKKNQDYLLKNLESETSPLQIVIFTVSIDMLYKDKLQLIRERAKARDLFDLWFLSQKLAKPFPKTKYHLNQKQIKSELRKYLPKTHWRVIEELL